MSDVIRQRPVFRHINTEEDIFGRENQASTSQNKTYVFGGAYEDFSNWSLVFKNILEGKRDTDFKFIVGKEKQVFEAHRYILETRTSSKLCEIFEEEKHCLELPSITPIAFEYFLKYIYCGDLPTGPDKRSAPESNNRKSGKCLQNPITENELLELLRLAISFSLISPPGMLEKCISLIEDQITVDNVCSIYEELFVIFGQAPISGKTACDKCFNYMCKHASSVVQSEGFMGLSKSSLSLFLKSDEVQCGELELFQSLIRWGKGVDGKNQDYNNRNEFIKDLIFLIRFPLMSTQKIAQHVSTSNLLTPEQLVVIYNYLCAGDVSMRSITIFSDKPRKTGEDNTKSIYPPTTPNTAIASNVSTQTEIITERTIIAQNSGASGRINSEPVIPNLPSEQSLFDESNSSISTMLGFSTSTGLTETESNCSTILSPQTLKDATKLVKDLSTTNLVNMPLSEVEFIMPMEPPKRKKIKKIFISPPSSVISSVNTVCDGHMLSANRRKRKKRNESDDDSDDDLINLFIQDGLEYKDWNTFLHRYSKSETIKNVAGIKLTNYNIVSLYPQIDMPKLREFYLQLNLPINPNGQNNAINSLYRFQQAFDIRRFLFFKKLVKLDYIWVLNLTVELVINGVIYLKMSRVDKEVTISFRNDSVELMGAMIGVEPETFEKLNLVGTDLPGPGFTCSGLKEVVLYRVIDQFETELSTFLRKCKNLETLTCCTERQKWDDGDPPIQDKSPIDLSQDLVSKKKLTRLSLAKIVLLYQHKPSTFQQQALKANLTEFYADFCHFSPDFFREIHNLFPNLKRVFFRGCKYDFEDASQRKLLSFVTVRLLINLLRIKTLKWIRICGMDWSQDTLDDSAESPRILTRNRHIVTEAETLTIKNFLTEAGLSEEPTNFQLHTNAISEIWEGKEFNKKDNGYTDYMHELEFEQCEMRKIYDKFETFVDYLI